MGPPSTCRVFFAFGFLGWYLSHGLCFPGNLHDRCRTCSDIGDCTAKGFTKCQQQIQSFNSYVDNICNSPDKSESVFGIEVSTQDDDFNCTEAFSNYTEPGIFQCIDCSGLNLINSQIPCLHNSTRFLLMDDNPLITDVPAEYFVALAAVPLAVVDFSNTGISSIPSHNAFRFLGSLTPVYLLALNNLTLTGGIAQFAFNGVQAEMFTMTSTRFIGGAAVNDRAFSQVNVNLLDMSGSTFSGEGGGLLLLSMGQMNAVYLNLSDCAFLDGASMQNNTFAATIVLQHVNMSGVVFSGTNAIYPETFNGLRTGGLDLAGATFPEATLAERMVAVPSDLADHAPPGGILPALLFRNLAIQPNGLNAKLQPTFLNLSNCNISVLNVTDSLASEASPLSASFLQDSTLEGPFTGLVMSNGTLTLAHNNLQRITLAMFKGATVSALDLSNNNISLYEPAWSGVLLESNAEVNTTGNPSVCITNLLGVSSDSGGGASLTARQTLAKLQAVNEGRYTASVNVSCICARGTLGTGTFCGDETCKKELLTALNFGAKHGAFEPNEDVASGERVYFNCDDGWFSPTVPHIECRGGVYDSLKVAPECTNSIAIPIVAAIVAVLVFTSGWLNKNYMLYNRMSSPCPTTFSGLFQEIFMTLAIIVPGLSIYLTRVHKRQMHKERRKLELTEHELSLTSNLLSTKEAQLDEIERGWKCKWSDVTLGAELGRGAFGIVNVAHWAGNDVAVKRAIGQCISEDEVEVFEKEAKTMASLHHPNLVQFYGVGVTDTGEVFLVQEFMSKGTLRALLNKKVLFVDDSNLPRRSLSPKVEVPFTWALRRQFCADIAAGMLYLHTRTPPIVHRDLKSDNCLVGEGLIVKVSDFGTAATFQQHKNGEPNHHLLRGGSITSSGKGGSSGSMRAARHSFRKHSRSSTSDETDALQEEDEEFLRNVVMTATLGAGTPLWAAPEVQRGKYGVARYGLSSDVYSFACVMFEIATGELPFWHILNWKTAGDLFALISSGQRPKVPEGIAVPPAYTELMESCWHGTPELRPTFNDITTSVSRMPVPEE
eukprot:m.642298 g.642298  ORF g.642298 m.642298 type:complete len:1056 (+) comp22638_c0_seq4:208-3375(+)